MKTIAAISAATMALLGYGYIKTQDSVADAEYLTYIQKYGKSYATKDEYLLRLTIFQQNDKVIKEWNANEYKTHTLAHNKFSDYTTHEMSRIKNKKAHKEFDERANYNITFDGDIPESVNWVEKNVVSPVDELFLCAAGWAFAAAGAIESRHAINTGSDLIRLSPQQCVDCAREMGENWDNCDGGYTDDCMFYSQIDPLNTYADFPYIHD